MRRLDETARKALVSIGRATTPKVDSNSYNLKMSDLIGGFALPVLANSVVLIAAPEKLRSFTKSKSVIAGVPGCLIEQVQHPNTSTFIVDCCAFREGPWQDTDCGNARNLADEIYKAGERCDQLGKIALIASSFECRNSIEFPYISEPFEFDLSFPDLVQLEEGARSSKVVRAYLEQRSYFCEEQ